MDSKEDADRRNAAWKQHEVEEQAKRDDSGARYRLLVPHVIEGNNLTAGTEVGDGTDVPYNATPSNQMEGVNDAGRAEVNKVHQRLYGRDAPWHDKNSPVARARADAEEAAKQQEEERGSEPVSHQQAWERGHQEYRGQPTVPPHLRVSQPQTQRGGDTSLAMGPATPEQNPENPAVQVRSAKPISEQMPKEGAAGGGTQQTGKK